MVETSVVIVAAGMGNRMKANVNKQFLQLCGKSILERTIKVFEDCPLVTEIILVLKENEIEYVKKELISDSGFSKVRKIVSGGKERSDSVSNGVNVVEHDGIILIHDGARPLVTIEEITELILCVENNKAAVLGVPVTNTIKEVDEKGLIVTTLDRSKLWAVATPQGFKAEVIKKAIANSGQVKSLIWDDAMLVELLGQKVTMVKGLYTNIKITTPSDIVVGESIIKDRENK